MTCGTVVETHSDNLDDMKTLLRSLSPVLLAVLSAAISRSGAAAPPAAGTAAPAVSLQSQEGKTVTLEQNKGKWVVLYFYPKDFTSGCTTEAHNFQRDLALYEKFGAVVLGVSHDTADSHKSFCAKEGLNFKLLADTTGAVSKEYDSVMAMGDKALSARNTFLIDPTGVIRKVYLKVNPATHSDDVLADLATFEAKK